MTALIWKIKVSPQCLADPQASPCLYSLDSLTSIVLERVYKTYIPTKWESVRVCEGTNHRIHTLCAARINSSLYQALYISSLHQAQNHAVHCRDWEPQLGVMPAFTAESRGIIREGTISITQAELDQKKLLFPKVYQSSRIFFCVCLNFFYGSWGCLPAQWVAHSSL